MLNVIKWSFSLYHEMLFISYLNIVEIAIVEGHCLSKSFKNVLKISAIAAADEIATSCMWLC